MTTRSDIGESARSQKIVVTGAAGLVGQNLMPRLRARGFSHIVGIDKHNANTKILRDLQPDIMVVEADLAEAGDWEEHLSGADVLVLNHAQIGALTEEPFTRNNVVATKRVLDVAKAAEIPYMVHISSSVVNSLATDFYTESKATQEQLVLECGLPAVVLRPTLMYGWFDRKHLGWLAGFMKRSPVFPVPGNGKYLRQPLYVGDFCDVIAACIDTPRPGVTFNISGQEEVDYIDLVRELKRASGGTAAIIKIPYGLFWLLLRAYAVADKNPPFTTKQLEALVTPDVFEVIDWPDIFGIKATPLAPALDETHGHPVYSKVFLEF